MKRVARKHRKNQVRLKNKMRAGLALARAKVAPAAAPMKRSRTTSSSK